METTPLPPDAFPSGDGPVKVEARQLPLEQRLAKATLFQGPLPPPDMLAEYNAVFPGCAERIVSMAERQSSHRQKMEGWLLFIEGSKSIVGQVFAFFIVIIGLIAGTSLLMQGKNGTGLLVAAVPLLTVAVTYFLGKKEQPEEGSRKEKSEEKKIK